MIEELADARARELRAAALVIRQRMEWAALAPDPAAQPGRRRSRPRHPYCLMNLLASRAGAR